MALPDLIEIVPPHGPLQAEITVPGSKSITNRALILAALSHGIVTLEGALWSEDTQVMAEALEHLGFKVQIESDPNEFCNRRIMVEGRGGTIPNAGTLETPLELFVSNAGTAARFLAAMVCLGSGVYRLSGVPRMHERPQAALFKALRELGYRIDANNDKLPAVIHGDARNAKETQRCTVSIEESSQFASALLLSAKCGGWETEIVGENADESPYVAMTAKLVESFPHQGGTFQIEPDASSGSYFWAASPAVSVRSWPESDWQIDAKFRDWMREFVASGGQRPIETSRETDLGDSIMTAIVMAPHARLPLKFTELGRLRVQETERVHALRTELTKCGAQVVEPGDTLMIHPGALHGAEIETYNDHRMAMCFAILGLKVPGIKLKNPACVKKTFPNFFQKLAAPAPDGLGVEIRHGSTGRRLELNELFAE